MAGRFGVGAAVELEKSDVDTPVDVKEDVLVNVEEPLVNVVTAAPMLV